MPLLPTRMKALCWLLSASALCGCAPFSSAGAQINPAEIDNPQLKAAETTYFQQIISLSRAIHAIKTPFPLQLSPYVGLDPRQQAGADSRGVEFVHFQNRLLLKISGNYDAAYNSGRLTQNQRAGRTFSDVVTPILAVLPKYIPEDVACDGVGFEIAYHVRSDNHNFDYEGKEVLVAVFERDDAFSFAGAKNDAERQQILNRSDVYVDGKQFGLALGKENPVDLDSIGKTVSDGPAPPSTTARAAADSGRNSSLVNPNLLPPRRGSAIQFGNSSPALSDISAAGNPAASLQQPASPGSDRLTPADAEHLQSQFQEKLDALASAGPRFHFVDYAPPSFVLYRKQIDLQMTLQNSLRFSAGSSSIYKRAAQSFDLFLAPQLKDLLDKTPADAPFEGYDITILNQLDSDQHASSEAVEFICPRSALEQFADADITNQQLIDQSIVLVNGVRIALNLQLVE